MLDPFDYKEPSCPTSDGKQFYYPSQDDPKGKIPVRRIIERLDSFFEVNDTVGAGDFLRRWAREAKELGDEAGEVTVQSELMGYYRKEGDRERALEAVDRGLYLTEKLGIGGDVSGATVCLNAATVYKTFGMPREALELYEKAAANIEARTYRCRTVDEIRENLAAHGDGFVKAMWCGEEACEDKVKELTGVGSRCIPFVQENIGDVCVCCGKPAKHMVLWGNAY